MNKLTEIEKCEHKYTSGGTVVITRFDKMDRRIDQYPSTTIFCEKCGEIKK